MNLLDFLIIFTGISLDLPFSSSLMILLISSALQSYRKILLGFEPGMKVLKLGMSSFLSGDNDLFIFGARETKYLLNSSAIIRRSIMRSLLIINEGLMDSLFLPRSWFIAAHVFLWLLTLSRIFF